MEKGVASDTWRSSLWRWEAGVRVSPEACKQSPQNVPSPERGFKGYFSPPFFFSFLGVGMIRALVVLFLCLDGLLLRFQSNANYYYYYFLLMPTKWVFCTWLFIYYSGSMVLRFWGVLYWIPYFFSSIPAISWSYSSSFPRLFAPNPFSFPHIQ